MRTFGARDHEVTVTGAEQLAPNFRRVHLRSDTLLDEAVTGPTGWVRFWFPDPEKPDVEHQRGYTLVDPDPETGAFAVDFVLHEPAGPASIWARRAAPGDAVLVQSLGSSKFSVPEELPEGYLLLGDAASIPAVNGILGALPHEARIELYLEQHDEADALIPLRDHPRLAVHRIPRTGPAALARAIEDRDWSNWYAWAGTESGTLKHLRARLRDDFGFPRSETHALAYWYEGRAMGKLRGGDGARAADEGPGSETAADLTATEDREAHREQPAERPRSSWNAQVASRLLSPLTGSLVAAGILQALVVLLQLVPYLLLVELARELLGGGDPAKLWALALWAAIALGAGALLEALLQLWLHIVDARFETGLRTRLLGKLARLPLGWFTARGSGRIKQLVQDDTLSLHTLVTHAIPDAAAAVVAPVAVLAYLFVVDWKLALLLFAPVLVYIVLMWVMVVQSGAKVAEAQEWAERMDAEAAAYLDAQPVVRVFGGAAASRFREHLSRYVTFLDGWQRPFVGKKGIMDVVTRPGTFLWLLAAVGTWRIVAGTLEPVDLLPFLLLGTTFGSRLLGIGYGLSGIKEGLVAARSLQLVLDERELQQRFGGSGSEQRGSSEDRPSDDDRATAGLRVEFDDVVFGYRPGLPVIDGVSLDLAPGTLTALVGVSGSGKSTLASLLARFHDVDSGSIRVDGRDIRDLSPDELYTRVGFVFQDARLVRGTVRENIALAVPGADDDAVERAARDAQIHERIMELPDGYGTRLDDGNGLSGGERQRICIARAILADTPVLVLDEATAFADPESEHLVQRALGRLTRERTVLVIAHRLHTIVHADRIVVLAGGRILEQGRHEELLSGTADPAGRYRELWEASGSRVAAPDEATR